MGVISQNMAARQGSAVSSPGHISVRIVAQHAQSVHKKYFGEISKTMHRRMTLILTGTVRRQINPQLYNEWQPLISPYIHQSKFLFLLAGHSEGAVSVRVSGPESLPRRASSVVALAAATLEGRW